MVRAVWNGVVLAESANTVRLEGNHYFPPESVNQQYLLASTYRSICPWKGVAHYYDVAVEAAVNPDAAWYYPNPSPLARRIKHHVAFWHGVVIEVQPEGDQRADRGLLQRLRGR